MNDCPSCKPRAPIEFRASSPDEGFSRDVRQEQLRYGVEISPLCGHLWWWDPCSSFTYSVRPNQFDLYNKWKRTTLSFSEEWYLVLGQIGGMPKSPFSLETTIQFPCSITTSQHKIDFAILCFQKAPPLFTWQDPTKTILITDVTSVSISPYTLPPDVRLATWYAEEAHMGYSPTLIELLNNEQVLVSGGTLFLPRSPSEVAGARLPNTVNNKVKHEQFLWKLNTYVIVDWSDTVLKYQLSHT